MAPFPMPQLERPVFADRTFSIVDHGAKPGGDHLNTGAFRKAIEACNKAGGGTVFVPAGKWLTGAIRLKTMRGRGGVVENLHFRDITMDGATGARFIDVDGLKLVEVRINPVTGLRSMPLRSRSSNPSRGIIIEISRPGFAFARTKWGVRRGRTGQATVVGVPAARVRLSVAGDQQVR